MKRMLCLTLALCLTLTLLACGGTVTSGVRPESAGAPVKTAAAAAAPQSPQTPEPAVTPEPTATPVPTPEPTATPAPVSQEETLNAQVFSARGVRVRITGLTFARDYEVTLDYEIVNGAEQQADCLLTLNSANCWSLSTQTAAAAGEEPYLDTVTVGAGETVSATVRYWIGDEAVRRIGMERIDHFSARVQVDLGNPAQRIGDTITYVEVTGAPEPDFAYPAGDALLESDALTVTSLGYDEKAQRAYLYIAHKTTRAGGSLIIYPAVNGVAVTGKFSPGGDDPGLWISTTNNKQMLLALDIAPTLALLGVDAPSRLSVCVNLQNSKAAPVTLDIPLSHPAPEAALPDDPVVAETDDLVVQYAGVQTGGEGDWLVFYVTNKTEQEFLISFKDGNLKLDGTVYSGWGASVLPPRVMSRFAIELHDRDGACVSGLHGEGSFIFDYSPFITGTDYYSGARYTDKVTVTLP